jgi:hypothetical protein
VASTTIASCMGPKSVGGFFPLPCGRIVVTAPSPARIVTKASHRRNGTQRLTSRAAPQPFTAHCISLDMIGDIGTQSRPSNVVVGDGGSGHLRLLPARTS